MHVDEPNQHIDNILFEEAKKFANFGIWELRENSKNVYWSKEVREIAGIESNENVSIELLKTIIHPDDQEKVSNSLLSALHNGTVHDVKYRVYRKNDGKLRSVQCSANQYIDKKTNEKKLIGIVQDISEYIFNVQALEKSLKEVKDYQEIADSAQERIAYIGRDYRYITVNKSYANFYNLARKQIVKQKMVDIVTEENFKMIKPLLDRCLEGEFFTKSDSFIVPNTIRVIYIEAKFSPYFNENEKVQGAVVSLHDITREKEALQKAAHASHEASSYLDITSVMIVAVDTKANITLINNVGSKILGYSEKELIGKNWIELFVPPDVKEKNGTAKLSNGTFYGYHESEIITKSCERKLIAWNNIDIKDENGDITGIISSGSDITEFRKNELRLRQFAAVVENTSDGVVITNSKNRILAVNKAFCEITKFNEKEVLGKSPAILKSGRHDKSFYRTMWKSIEENGSWSGEIYNRHKDTGVHPEWLSIKAIKDNSGNIDNYVGVFSDLSDIKESENKLVYLSYHDSLTGLSNRTMIASRLKHALAIAKRNDEKLAVLFLDLDNFKKINDTYGHDTGDIVLIETANRFSKILRSEDTLARFGGDEFVVLLENVKTERNIIILANKLLDCFKEPFDIEGTNQFLTASIGIAIFPDNAKDSTSLLKSADTAMYKSKEIGKNNFSFYSSSLGEELLKQMMVENSLREAISQEQFELYYQPQISCKDEMIIGFEALVRWNHPQMGFIGPNNFISIAEKGGLIVPLGRWILNKACLQVASWQKDELFNGRIAVNVSVVQMEQGDIIKDIKEAILLSNINPNKLEIEITESILMKNPQKWIYIFKQIRELGVYLSIDDFGTGYSSLSYLRQIPLDKLKIDKSFVDDIPLDDDACAIANSIIALAKSLGFSTLAEGVEKREQAQYLKDKGCDFVQGYLYDKPLSYIDATQKLLSKHKEL